jgi:hypothetical protein
MKNIRRRSVLGALLVVSGAAVTSGCAAVAQWWQSVTSNPGSAMQFIQYVLAFLQGIVSLWSTIAPLIPATALAQANTTFNNAVYTVEQAVAALEDAIKAAAAAQTSDPNFATLIANVQAAVAALVSIFQQWQGDAGASPNVSPSAPSPQDIYRQAGVIAAWK